MGINSRFYVMIGHSIDSAIAELLDFHDDYPEEYEGSDFALARRLRDQGVYVLFDGMSGKNHYLGFILHKSADNRWEAWEFQEVYDFDELVAKQRLLDAILEKELPGHGLGKAKILTVVHLT